MQIKSDLIIDELKKLWITTFGDDKSYVDAFFDKFYNFENVLTHVEDGKIVSALYMIDYCLKYDGKYYKIMYLYALATDIKYRRRGIMSKLITIADEIVHKKGYAGAFLIPAEDSLYDYYGQFGFKDIIYNKSYKKLNYDDIEESFIECHDSNMIYKIDNNHRNSEDVRIVLSKEQNEFMCNMFLTEGGKIFINLDGNKYIMVETDSRSGKFVIYSTNDYDLYDKTYVKAGLFKKNEDIFKAEPDISRLILDKILE